MGGRARAGPNGSRLGLRCCQRLTYLARQLPAHRHIQYYSSHTTLTLTQARRPDHLPPPRQHARCQRAPPGNPARHSTLAWTSEHATSAAVLGVHVLARSTRLLSNGRRLQYYNMGAGMACDCNCNCISLLHSATAALRWRPNAATRSAPLRFADSDASVVVAIMSLCPALRIAHAVAPPPRQPGRVTCARTAAPQHRQSRASAAAAAGWAAEFERWRAASWPTSRRAAQTRGRKRRRREAWLGFKHALAAIRVQCSVLPSEASARGGMCIGRP